MLVVDKVAGEVKRTLEENADGNKDMNKQIEEEPVNGKGETDMKKNECEVTVAQSVIEEGLNEESNKEEMSDAKADDEVATASIETDTNDTNQVDKVETKTVDESEITSEKYKKSNTMKADMSSQTEENGDRQRKERINETGIGSVLIKNIYHYAYENKEQINKHLKRHIQEKVMKCSCCSCETIKVNDLQLHTVEKHSKVFEKHEPVPISLQCPKCEFTSENISILAQHFIDKHSQK